jgi:hypothetical protein
MLFIGPKARILGFRPEVVLGLSIINAFSVQNNFDCMLSHGIDGVHSRASIHYNGGAADIVFISPISSKDKIEHHKKLSKMLGQDFDLLLEDLGSENEHLHCEFQPKETY